MSLATIALLTPEIVLIAVAVGIFMLGVLVRAEGTWSWMALGGIIVAAVALSWQTARPTGEPLVVDGLALYVRWLSLVSGGLLVLVASRPAASQGSPEYVASLLLTVAGMMLVSVANELVLLFVGLELISIPTYVLLYLGRRNAASQESATKYFFLSILASATLLYGLSFLYGIAGSTSLATIHDRLAATAGDGGPISLAKLALVMVIVGLGFRITAVPFHFYAPDVYQGTTHANAAFLSVVPKIAGFMALIRIVAIGMAGVGPTPWRIVFGLAVVTMTLGNTMGLWQDNIRRLMAYSSIAHAGYLLVALAAYLAAAPGVTPAWDGIAALLFYLLVYAAATIGAFAALDCLSRGEKQIDGIEDLAGLAWTGGPMRRFLAWALAIFMFSLTGIPPLAGFWGKLAIFLGALNTGDPGSDTRGWFIGLAVVGVLNAAISAGYYLKVVGVMFFRTPLATPKTREEPGLGLLATAFCLLLVLAVGLAPGFWTRQANRASPARVAVHAAAPSP